MTFTIDTSVKSSNFNDRPKGVAPSAICLHSTEGRWPSDLHWLGSLQSGVSCHYVISPAGKVFQLVPDAKRAWHAGVGTLLGISDWNDVSIGIECSHKHGDPWPDVQRTALRELCLMLIERYSIRQSMIVAHRWVAPDRRSDPTDWPDPELAAWIAALYKPAAPDYAALWGLHYFYFADSGIAQAWRPYATVLREAVSDETSDKAGRVWRLFRGGAVSWTPDGTEVYLPRSK